MKIKSFSLLISASIASAIVMAIILSGCSAVSGSSSGDLKRSPCAVEKEYNRPDYLNNNNGG